MGLFIGIDAFPRGWVAAYLHENGSQQFDYAPTIERLLVVPFSRAMIDVPIGLPTRGYRVCDIEAVSRVGSRVFLGARWAVWSFESYRDANAHYWSDNDTGISKQLWCIRDNLQQINELMTPELQLRLSERIQSLFFCGSTMIVSSTPKIQYPVALNEWHCFRRMDSVKLIVG
jgi:predicted RNase H-like nuclease